IARDARDLVVPRLFTGTREIDEGAAVEDGTDRGQQLDISRLLDDVAGRAGLERGLQVRRIVVHREHEHAGARRDPHQLLDRLREVGSGHGQVEQHDVRRSCLSTANRRGTVPDLAHYVHVGLRVDEQLEAGPEDRVVVGDEPPDGRHARYARRVGKWAVIVVPPPARDSTSSEPPSRAARSRMTCRPRCRSPRSPAAGSAPAAGSKPAPSSCTRNSTRALPRTSRTLTLRASACFATLVSASCRTRYTVV